MNAQDRLSQLVAATKDPAEATQEDVLSRLFDQGHQFDFFQAVRLLEDLFAEAPGPGQGFELAQERIRFKPYDGLGFPAADVKKVSLVDDGRKPPYGEVMPTFMGLYGIDSPLPSHVSNLLLNEADGESSLRDFLDIFNHRFYSLFYRSWKKYRSVSHSTSSGFCAASFQLLCLAGVDPELRDRLPVAADRLMPLAALLACPTRSTEGLIKILKIFFPQLAVEVVENVARWARISDPPGLGRGENRHTLGETAIVGRSLIDRSGMFRLVLGPVDFKSYREFLPGGRKAELLHGLLRRYVPDFLKYEIQIFLKTATIPSAQLGSPDVKLGQQVWIGKPKPEVLPHVVQY